MPPRPVRLAMESLEDRWVPTTWPVTIPAGQVAQLLGTYGQYQERELSLQEKTALGFTPPLLNQSIQQAHLHEGIDIPATSGTEVKAVKAGRIEAIFRDPIPRPGMPPDYSAGSFIVVRDLNAGQLGDRGWNYKHVVARATLRVGDDLAEGDSIGTVGVFPDATYYPYGPHLHLDRGLAGVNPPKGSTRDKTMKDTYAYKGVVNALARANDATKPYWASMIEGLRWQYAPTINPLSEFIGVPGVVDTIAPTVNKIDFRLDADNGTKIDPRLKDPKTGQPILEAVRNTDRYFQDVATIGQVEYRQLGRYAVAKSQSGATSGPKSDNNANIDFVVSAYDQFGDVDDIGTQKLNPASFEFNVKGVPGDKATKDIDSGNIRSFDFSKVTGTPTPGVNDFFNIPKTRVIYENDQTHNTVFPVGDNSDPFWYIVTDTPNVLKAATQQPEMGAGMPLSKDPGGRWSSLAAKDKPFGVFASATSNATAAYPDGTYWVRVRATDLNGNTSEFHSENVLLTNWKRTIGTDKLKYQPTDAIKVTRGDQYLANQNVDIYVMASEMGMTTNAPLAAGDKKGTATANASGQLTLTNLGMKAAGNYVVIADYNGDGIYTQGLDAITAIRVIEPGMPPPVGGVTLATSVNPSHFTETVTFTATVTSPFPDGYPPPGWIDFYDGTEYLGTSTITDGIGTWTASDLGVGDHTILASYWYYTYPGEYSASLTQTILPNTTTVTLSADRASLNHLEQVELTAVVTAPWTPPPPSPGVDIRPTGAVEFSADGEVFASVPVDSTGTASVFYLGLDRGSPVITAHYIGDTTFEESTSDSLTETVANNPPVAAADAVTTTDSAAVLIRVLGNDSDPDYDDLTITGVTTPTNGTASFTADRVTYTPNPGFLGDDTFTYTVSDGNGGMVSAAVTVHVLPQWAGNRVFADTNGNGVQDPGEAGIPLVVVNVYDNAGYVIASVLTDDNGYYTLPPDLPAGYYRLGFILPPGMEPFPFTAQDVGGNDATDSDVDATGFSGWFTFDPAQGWPDIDAGVVVDPNDPAVAWLFW